MPVKRIDMPDHGRIHGGRLAGWNFKFLHYVVQPDEAKVLARVTPPHWPFPRDLVLEAEHWVGFMPDKDAKQLNGDQLIFDEYKVYGIAVPKYLVDGSERMKALVDAAKKKRRVSK